MLYQILDSASPPHAAVVDVIRNLMDMDWQIRTQGAFEPHLLIDSLKNVAIYSDGAVDCNADGQQGTFSVFRMNNYFAFGKFAHDEGKGTLYVQGVAGGNMKAGPMTWKKL